MKFVVFLPHERLLEETVEKIVAEGEHGLFGLLPRHIDMVSSLVPGILAYTLKSGETRYLAVDEGLLVKQGTQVTISVRNAIPGPDLGELKTAVEEQFQSLNEEERRARTALASLESNFMKQIAEMEPHE